MKKTSSRMIRINEEIKKALSLIIRTNLKDPRIHAMTTVINVITTNDLKYCKVYISVLGTEEEQKETLKGLNSAVKYIRNELAHTVNLRYTPELTFFNDQSIEYSVNMSKLIYDVNKKDEK